MPKKENNRRKFPGESSKHRPDKASQRREDAAERQQKSDALTTEEKIQKLDMKFGVGIGAKKERARLALIIEKSKVKNLQSPDSPQPELSDAVLQEIAALNEETSGKKKIKAKERRAKSKSK